MIFVVGVSCAGKTYTVGRLLEWLPNFRRVSASGLLAELGRPLRPLSPEEALENQSVLAKALVDKGLADAARVLLDGHATIETTEGPLPVPDGWYDRLGFSAIIFLEASPADVAKRRAGRGLPWSLEEAARNQEFERAQARYQAERLGLQLFEVGPSDVDRLAARLEALVSSKRVGPIDR
jgi:adenylate kinase